MNTPSLPKELHTTNPPPPFPGMETRTGTNYAKTVSLIETVLQKNPVVSYNTNTIYTLLLFEEIKEYLEQVMDFGSSMNGKGGGEYHAN